MATFLQAFAADQAADGTAGGSVRVLFWTLAALGLLGYIGPKLYNAFKQSGNCMAGAAGMTTNSFNSGNGAVGTC